MDLIVDPLDEHLLTPYVYPESWPQDDLYRQIVTSFFVLLIGGGGNFFFFATLSYVFVFDHEVRKHPRFLPNQEIVELKIALKAIFWISVYTTPILVAELRGYSKLYDWDQRDEYHGAYGILMSIVGFVAWCDVLLYFIHRGFHHPMLYERIHKTHHIPSIPTPYASVAFTPADGFLQSVPAHAFIFLFPFCKPFYVTAFVFLQVWTVLIHDHECWTPDALKGVINGSQHHSDHHAYFINNYGQYFTFMDKIFGTYSEPRAWSGNSVHDAVRRFEEAKKEKKRE